ncbi:hypothetical protein ACFLSA_02675 [Bacteroidota bacterium]
MKKFQLLFLLVLITSLGKLFSQNYDLIVKTNGDFIACHIDSITDTHIYFKMRMNHKWLDMQLTKENIRDYSRNSIDKNKVVFKPGTSFISFMISDENYNHISKYLFSPTAFGLKKDELYYNSYYFLEHDFQYGFTDRFSMTFGASFILALYITPMYSFPLNDKSSFAIGDLFLISGGEFDIWGNLLYGLYTRGSAQRNFSAGLGLWTYPVGDGFIGAPVKSSPVFNLSAHIKVSQRVYFLTENYAFSMDIKKDTYNRNLDQLKYYYQNKDILFGLTGFRFVRKKNPLASWQISILHGFMLNGPIPDEYDTNPEWEVHDRESTIDFAPIPMLSYSRKIR